MAPDVENRKNVCRLTTWSGRLKGKFGGQPPSLQNRTLPSSSEDDRPADDPHPIGGAGALGCAGRRAAKPLTFATWNACGYTNPTHKAFMVNGPEPRPPRQPPLQPHTGMDSIECSACNQQLPRSAFSKTQPRKPADTQRCKQCVVQPPVQSWITGLAEMHQPERVRELAASSGGQLILSADPGGDTTAGSGIFLSPRTRRLVMSTSETDPVKGGRIVWARLKGEFHNVLVVNVYIPPHSRVAPPHRDDVYDLLGAVLRKIVSSSNLGGSNAPK